MRTTLAKTSIWSPASLGLATLLTLAAFANAQRIPALGASCEYRDEVIYISDIAEGSAAAQSMENGDWMLFVGRDRVRSCDEFINAVAALPPNSNARFNIYRQGEPKEIFVNFASGKKSGGESNSPSSDLKDAFDLAENYHYGRNGYSKDEREASRLYRSSCNDGGHMESCNRLGQLYNAGVGVSGQDKYKAAGYFEKACNGGVAKACNSLASIHESDNNHERARKFYKMACAEGHNRSCEKMNSAPPQEQRESRKDSLDAELKKYELETERLAAQQRAEAAQRQAEIDRQRLEQQRQQQEHDRKQREYERQQQAIKDVGNAAKDLFNYFNKK